MNSSQPEYSVKELLNKASAALQNIFEGEVWVSGVIKDYGSSSAGHSYFSLCEDNGEGAAEHTLAIALFARTKSQIDIDFQLEDGMEVKIRGRVDIYKPRSQIQMVMSQIDSDYTISKMAKDKELLLKHLQKEGILEQNKLTELTPIPLKVALVTSENSAAHKDFEDELKKSRFNWEMSLVHTLVQGVGAPAEIVAALKAAAELKPDVIALVRGGGGSMDLAAFDDESVARAIADMQVPIFSGIGHEIDTSVADYAVHTHTKTPTACAGALIALMLEAEQKLEDFLGALIQNANRTLSEKRHHLTQLAARTSMAPGGALNSALNAVLSFKANLLNQATNTLANQKSRVADMSGELQVQAKGCIKIKQKELFNHKKYLQSLDPKKLLAKGWSITRMDNGNLVRSYKDVPLDTILITQVKDGKIESRVQKK